jgi:signal transduction histidine kinase
VLTAEAALQPKRSPTSIDARRVGLPHREPMLVDFTAHVRPPRMGLCGPCWAALKRGVARVDKVVDVDSTMPGDLVFSTSSLPPAAAAILTLGAGILVLLHARRAPLARPFFAGSVAVAVWLGCYAIVYSSADAATALAWARRSYFGIVFMAPTMLHFVVLFLGRKDLRRVVAAVYVGALFFLVVSQGDHFIYDVHRYSWGYYPLAHELYYAFLVYFFGSAHVAFALLVMALRRDLVQSRRRAQTWHLLLAFGAAMTGTVDYLPKFGVDVYPYGYASILLYNVLTAHAIVRHRLMGVEMLVQRSIVFAGLVSVALGLVVVGATLVQDLVTRGFEVPAWTGHLFAATIIAFTYRRLDAAMSAATQRFLFQKRHDYAAHLRIFGERIATELDLARLGAHTTEHLREMFSPRGVVLAAPTEDGRHLRVVSCADAEIEMQDLPAGPGAELALREPICESDDDGRRGWLDGCARGGFRPAMSMPLQVHGEPYGLLLLGPKRAGTAYTSHEIDVLGVLSQTLAISLHNAHQATALAEALARAREAALAKSEFVASVSHELRTPLNSIVNIPEALLEDLVPVVRARCQACSTLFALEPEETVEDGAPCPECGAAGLSEHEQLEYVGEADSTARHLRSIVGAARHLLAVVEDLLDFSKAEAGKLEIHKRPTPLAEIAAAVRDATSGTAAARRIALRFDVAAVESVVADPLRLTQVLVNLVGNAIRFSPEGSDIVVRAVQRADGCELSVIDHGIGIADADREIIFESFRQVHGGNTKRYGGTGLGLAIVKRFVDAMGGTISVCSELGRGSTFVVWLPATDEESRSDEEDRAA